MNRQQKNITDLYEEGLNRKQIMEKINKDPLADNVSYDQVKRVVSKYITGHLFDTPKKSPGRPSDERIDGKILQVLDEEPAASVRQIAQTTHIPATTVWNHLTHDLDYKYRTLRWVPHVLDEEKKMKRVTDSKELLGLLNKAEKDNWQFLYTGDESWFFYDNHVSKIWLADDEEVPTVPRHDMNSKKIMICIFWNPHGIIVIDGAERGTAINSEMFIDNILTPIANSEQFEKAKRWHRTFTLHMDNSRVHRSKKVKTFMQDKSLHNAPQPPYSPDLAPSDFYLFGYLKYKLKERQFSSVEELKQWIIDEFSQIEYGTLEKVFHEWVKRLQTVISTGGEYI